MSRVQRSSRMPATTGGFLAALLFCAHVGGCVQSDESETGYVRHGFVVVDGASLYYTVEGRGHSASTVAKVRATVVMMAVRRRARRVAR
jgi:hypothetical protein